MRRKKLSIIGALCLASATGIAQEPAARAPVPYRSGVEAVQFDVSVLDDDGMPVTGLGPADFTVTVAGEPRRVVSATFVGQNDGPAAGATAEPRLPTVSTNEDVGGGRMVVFVVDQATLEQSEARQVSDGASRLIEHLSPTDRSALVLMPVGSGIPFTTDHPRVLQGLKRATGLASQNAFEHTLGLEEVRAIASGDYIALKTAASRECPAEGTIVSNPPPSGGAQGGPGGAQVGGNGAVASVTSPSAFDSADSCTRRLQFDASSTWQHLHAMSLASMTTLRTVLRQLQKVPGPKTVVLISGGWPLELRDASSEIAPLADAAADAGATIYTLFAMSSEHGADRRTISAAPLSDQTVRRWPLEALAGMTGGGSFRVDVGAGNALDRVGRELSGTYRLGVERDPRDFDGRGRPLRVQVSRRGVTLRAPERFVARSYADRDVPARLEAALTSPMPSTGIGMRLTTYLTANPDAPNLVKVMLVGDASGLQPGEVKVQVLLQNPSGAVVESAAQTIGPATSERLPFTTSVAVAPGRYVIRAAVMDAAGSVGSVDRAIDATGVMLGAFRSGDLLLARLPRAGGGSEFLLDEVRRDERLGLQIDLAGDHDQVSHADVVFEIAATDDGPALVTSEATFMSGNSSSGLAQALADVRLLPPGLYVARARVRSGDAVSGVVRRPFLVTAVPTAKTDVGPDAAAGVIKPVDTGRIPAKPPFSVAQVLATPVLGRFLDRLAARPDAASAPAVAVIARLREEPPGEVTIPGGLGAEAPVVAPFATGLGQFARGELDPAAQSFRAAMRASGDFYPAMVYLGACFAAGGKDREAAGAWQTALIKEGDVPALHGLLADALLRLDKPDAALAAVERARTRWPDDPEFARRYVVAALAAGRTADALSVLDGLPADHENEPALALGLQALYEAMAAGRPIVDADADRARLLRLAETYRKLDGPSAALVNAWVAAASKPK